MIDTIVLLGNNWIIDGRLGGYRSVVNVGDPVVFFTFREMDNMIAINDVLDNSVIYEIDREAIIKLRKLFENAMKGDKSTIDEIDKMCNEDDHDRK